MSITNRYPVDLARRGSACPSTSDAPETAHINAPANRPASNVPMEATSTPHPPTISRFPTLHIPLLSRFLFLTLLSLSLRPIHPSSPVCPVQAFLQSQRIRIPYYVCADCTRRNAKAISNRTTMQTRKDAIRIGISSLCETRNTPSWS
jgi:hypothetical protein